MGLFALYSMSSIFLLLSLLLSTSPVSHASVEEEFYSLKSLQGGVRRTKEDVIADAQARWAAGTLHPYGFEHSNSYDTIFMSEEVVGKPLPVPPVPISWDPRNSSWNTTCPSIFHVRDQGDCDGSWSAAVSSAFTDRLCMQANMTHPSSAEDILSCCGGQCGLGCSGGLASQAWSYLYTTGAVTGGDYNSTEPQAGCFPYSLPPCNLSSSTQLPCAPDGTTQTPFCSKECANGRGWEAEKMYGTAPYWLLNDTETIKAEIFYNGPVTATIDLYADFFVQLSHNIYRNEPEAPYLGTLTVKLFGYGSDYGVPFWHGVATWGANWGANGGFFRIARGLNVCNVESTVVAAMVQTPSRSELVSDF